MLPREAEPLKQKWFLENGVVFTKVGGSKSSNFWDGVPRTEISPLPLSSANDMGYKGYICRLIVSIHSTANDIVTGPPADETNFMVWAQAGIED